MWLDLFTVNIFLRLTVKILSFLRLTAKFFETLLHFFILRLKQKHV